MSGVRLSKQSTNTMGTFGDEFVQTKHKYNGHILGGVSSNKAQIQWAHSGVSLSKQSTNTMGTFRGEFVQTKYKYI